MNQIFLFLCLILANLKYVHPNCSLSEVMVRKYKDQRGFFEVVPLDRKNIKVAVKLAIQDQDFPELCADAFSGAEVPTIYFADNIIGEVKPGAFANIHGLRQLLLRKSALKEIKSGIFNGLGIEFLDLSINQITNIAGDAFDDMRNLEKLFLTNNKLTKVNNQWFRSTPNLYWIMLNENYIDELPEGSIGFPTEPEKPVRVSLFNNLIRNVEPRAFQNFTADTLVLANNRLTSIPENILFNVKSADYLVLAWNSIKCLDERVLNTLKMVQKIVFSDILDNCNDNMKVWGAKNGVEILVIDLYGNKI